MIRVVCNSQHGGEIERAERDLWIPSMHEEDSQETPASVKHMGRRPRVKPMHPGQHGSVENARGERKTGNSVQRPG